LGSLRQRRARSAADGRCDVSRYILRRLVLTIPMLLGITIIAFTFMNVAPGDPVSAMIDPQMGAAGLDMDELRRQYGLDKPLPVRYAIWLKEVASGNFGYSYVTKQPVLRRIAERVGPTVELMGIVLLFSTVVGCALGIGSALNRYRAWDYVLTGLSMVWISVPAFFFALVALYLFALQWRVLPTFGMGTPGSTDPFDHLKHLVLPASVLSLEALAAITRYSRSAMLDVLKQDYVVTARAKGLAERVVTLRHAFRNALLPVITVVSLRIPALLGGAVVIESVFQWPGMGTLAILSIQQRDYPVLMGLTLMTSTLVLLSNLLADVLYAYADPRIRYS
jgi:peptide/nickel transport system permease protein